VGTRSLNLNKVKKTGDTMVGELVLDKSANLKLLHSNAVGGGILQASGTANSLIVRNIADTDQGTLLLKHMSMFGNLTITGTVDGVDVSAIDQAKIITGTFTGDGNDDRTINIGVDLTAKNNVWVVVLPVQNRFATSRTEYAQGDLSKPWSNVIAQANYIQDFVATGFQIGNNAAVNTNGETFTYIVMYEEP